MIITLLCTGHNFNMSIKVSIMMSFKLDNMVSIQANIIVWITVSIKERIRLSTKVNSYWSR